MLMKHASLGLPYIIMYWSQNRRKATALVLPVAYLPISTNFVPLCGYPLHVKTPSMIFMLGVGYVTLKLYLNKGLNKPLTLVCVWCVFNMLSYVLSLCS